MTRSITRSLARLSPILLLCVAAFAQAPDPCATAPQTCATIINTHATERTRIPNTAVDVSVGITNSERDLPTAQRTLSAKSAKLMAFLRAQGVERLITTNVSFQPDTRSQKNGPDKTVGYTGTLTVAFRTTPEKAPDVLGGALANGANTIDSTAFTPTETEFADAERELAAKATKTAIAQADAIARAAGMHVVAVREIGVENAAVPESRPVPYPMMARMAGMASKAAPPPMPTATGEQEVSVGVSIAVAAAR